MMLACGGGLVAAYGVGHLYPAIALWAFTAAMLIGLVPIARRAWMAAINGTPFSIEMLMTIAAIGAMFIGATEKRLRSCSCSLSANCSKALPPERRAPASSR